VQLPRCKVSVIFNSLFQSARRSNLWGRLAASGGLAFRLSQAVYPAAAASSLLLVTAVVACTAVVDRIAVVVGKNVITESELLQDLRITEFLNQQPLDLSSSKRRDAAEKMVDQQFLRKEMETSHFAMPDASRADTMLADFRREHFANEAAFHAALQRYGITEAELKQRLLWQLAVIQFTDVRFRPELPPPPPPNVQTANRMRAGAPPPASDQRGQTVDEVMDQWLKQERSSTRIVFKQEAFQ
jgi:hypothetical protein